MIMLKKKSPFLVYLNSNLPRSFVLKKIPSEAHLFCKLQQSREKGAEVCGNEPLRVSRKGRWTVFSEAMEDVKGRTKLARICNSSPVLVAQRKKVLDPKLATPSFTLGTFLMISL